MKILHVIPVYEPAWHYGGPVRSVSTMCRELVKLGIDMYVYTTTANNANSFQANMEKPEIIGGVKVWRFPTIFDSNFFYSPSLARKLAETISQFDMLHITSIWNYPGLPSAKIAKENNVPYIYSARGSLIPEKNKGTQHKSIKKYLYYQIFLKRNFMASNSIHFTNVQELEMSKRFVPAGVKRIIIPNSIDGSEFSELFPREEILKNRFGLPIDAIIVAYLGRLHKEKRLEKLIEAFALISKEYFNSYLLIAGPDFGMKKELLQLVVNLGLEDKVQFLGLLNSVQRLELLSATDIFCLVSGGENFGISAAEAMAASIPVVVSPFVCIQDDIIEANAGLVANIDEFDIAEKIRFLIQNPEKRKIMGCAAKNLAFQKYDKKEVANLMKQTYEEIVFTIH